MQLKICGLKICLSSIYWEHYKFVSGPERRLGVLCPFACIDIETRVVVLHFFYWTRQLKFPSRIIICNGRLLGAFKFDIPVSNVLSDFIFFKSESPSCPFYWARQAN